MPLRMRVLQESRRTRAGWVGLAILVLIPLFATIQSAMGADTPRSGQFNRTIRPLLAEHCFRCHGPDAGQRKADLRLDERESAVRERDGVFTIRPGVSDESELLARVTSTDPALRMPPPGSGEPLTVEQIGQLRDWIADGAVYDRFWSLIPPRRHAAPALRDVVWACQPVDRWVLGRLEAEGLAPSPPATRETLIRRVTLDLTGLPPTERELDDFFADDAPDAYDRLVDRLLASPRFGERQTQFWLDAARYADTNGYFTDNERTMWRWRDGVIDSFNQNQPFDQFTIEQLAGDLLPDATEAQRIASGFNRNHMSNNETGLIDEEFRISYVMDRLETTGTVWLGLTLNCARCHPHKFDPLTQREYYQLLAYFNQVDEVGTVQGEGNSPPLISAPTADQVERLNRLKRTRDDAQAGWRALEPQVQLDLAEWSKDATTTLPVPTTSGLLARFSFESDLPPRSTVAAAPEHDAQPTLAAAGPDEKIGYASGVQGRAAQFDAYAHCVTTRVESFDFERTDSFTLGAWIHPTTGNAGCVLSKIDDDQFLRGFDLFYEKGKLVAHLNHRAESDAIRVKSTRPIVSDWQHVVVTYDGSSRAAGVRIYINGELDPGVIEFDNLRGSIRTTQPFRIGRRSDSLGFNGLVDEVCLFNRVLSADEISAWATGESVRSLLNLEPEKRTPTQKERLLRHYLQSSDKDRFGVYQRDRSTVAAVVEEEKRLPTTMVMRERAEKRKTFILTRGQYDQPTEAVEPAVPAALAGQGGDPAPTPQDRLEFARWLVNPRQALSSRVMVNRIWGTIFGTGLVKTTGDLGVQGEYPSHPELLDELALDFVESGWDMKSLVREIVTSATYRQQSTVTPANSRRDPDNRMLARGPRFRLDAESIRDQALSVSGLLTNILGGPSVRPYQPPGLWEAVSYDGGQSYVPSEGGDLYRRGLYTFWKRQSPPPGFLVWDGPTRETCVVNRSRTNTPLQALVLTNDVTFVEAARVWGGRLLREAASGSPVPAMKHVVARAFRQLTSRLPDSEESRLFERLYHEQLTEFQSHPEAATRLLRVGDAPPVRHVDGSEIDSAEWAALTTVLQVMLNLDEAVTKE